MPATAGLSNPVQWIMLVNEFVIAVVFQKMNAVLDDDGGKSGNPRNSES